MTSKITVKMNTCEKTHVITGDLNADGNVDINIESDCKNIQEFNERLRYLTMTDVTDYFNSRLIDKEIRGSLGHVCLIINAVTHVAWMEFGLLSERHAKNSKRNCIVYVEEESAP